MSNAPHPQTSGRSLFLGDIENLGWDPQLNTLTPERVRTTCLGVRRALWPFQPQEVVASSHYFAEMVWFHWDRPARRLVGSGPDGADLKLLEVLVNEGVSERYKTVFIGSGDGIFAEPAAKLAAQGVQVIALCGTGYLSKRLKLAVHNVIKLPFGAPPV